MCHKDVHTQLPGNGLGHQAPGHHPWGQEGEGAAHAERLRSLREAHQPGQEGPLGEQCLHQRKELVFRQGVAQTAPPLQPEFCKYVFVSSWISSTWLESRPCGAITRKSLALKWWWCQRDSFFIASRLSRGCITFGWLNILHSSAFLHFIFLQFISHFTCLRLNLLKDWKLHVNVKSFNNIEIYL